MASGLNRGCILSDIRVILGNIGFQGLYRVLYRGYKGLYFSLEA